MRRFFHGVWGVLKNNLHLKIVALLFAFIIWSYVMAGENPVRTKTITDIPIRYEGVDQLKAKDLTVELADMVQKVDVVLEAGQNTHRNLTANTITATVDLSTINSVGEARVNVNINCSVSGVKIVSSSVPSVMLAVDDYMERQVPIRCELSGEAKEGYYIGNVRPYEDTVTIKGAKNEVQNVVEAVCKVPVDGIESMVKGSYLLTLLDADGNQVTVDSLYGSVPSMIVEVEVLKKKNVKIEMPSLEELVTNVKPGYEVVGAEIDTKTVDIVGDEEVLAGIDAVQLAPINGDEADRSVLLKAEIQPMDGITVVSGNTVSIYIQIAEKQAERTFKSIPIHMDNLGEGLSASVNKKVTDVAIKGGMSTVKAWDRGEVRAYVDLKDLAEGTYVLPVKIDDMQDIRNVSSSVASVTVTIEKK